MKFSLFYYDLHGYYQLFSSYDRQVIWTLDLSETISIPSISREHLRSIFPSMFEKSVER